MMFICNEKVVLVIELKAKGFEGSERQGYNLEVRGQRVSRRVVATSMSVSSMKDLGLIAM